MTNSKTTNTLTHPLTFNKTTARAKCKKKRDLESTF